MQEAQRQTDDTFQQFMNDSLQAHWQQAKRRLLDSMLPSGGQGGFSPAAPLTVVGPAATAAQPGALQIKLISARLKRELCCDGLTEGMPIRTFKMSVIILPGGLTLVPRSHPFCTAWPAIVFEDVCLYLCCRPADSRTEGSADRPLQGVC